MVCMLWSRTSGNRIFQRLNNYYVSPNPTDMLLMLLAAVGGRTRHPQSLLQFLKQNSNEKQEHFC